MGVSVFAECVVEGSAIGGEVLVAGGRSGDCGWGRIAVCEGISRDQRGFI